MNVSFSSPLIRNLPILFRPTPEIQTDPSVDAGRAAWRFGDAFLNLCLRLATPPRRRQAVAPLRRRASGAAQRPRRVSAAIAKPSLRPSRGDRPASSARLRYLTPTP
jgi:hypothetical protein